MLQSGLELHPQLPPRQRLFGLSYFPGELFFLLQSAVPGLSLDWWSLYFWQSTPDGSAYQAFVSRSPQSAGSPWPRQTIPGGSGCLLDSWADAQLCGHAATCSNTKLIWSKLQSSEHPPAPVVYQPYTYPTPRRRCKCKTFSGWVEPASVPSSAWREHSPTVRFAL